MNKKRVLTAAMAAAILAGVASAYIFTTQSSSDPEAARDAVMRYIEENHPNARAYIGDIAWSGRRVTPEGLVGYETYVFEGGGWNVTVGWAVVPENAYDVKAGYGEIEWKGRVVEDEVVEELWTGLEAERAKEAALNFLLNAPTFKWDGVKGSVKVLEVTKIAEKVPAWEVEIAFTSLHGGYGDRTGKVVTQALTEHVATVAVYEEEIVYAYIDDVWDEILQTEVAPLSVP